MGGEVLGHSRVAELTRRGDMRVVEPSAGRALVHAREQGVSQSCAPQLERGIRFQEERPSGEREDGCGSPGTESARRRPVRRLLYGPVRRPYARHHRDVRFAAILSFLSDFILSRVKGARQPANVYQSAPLTHRAGRARRRLGRKVRGSSCCSGDPCSPMFPSTPQH